MTVTITMNIIISSSSLSSLPSWYYYYSIWLRIAICIHTYMPFFVQVWWWELSRRSTSLNHDLYLTAFQTFSPFNIILIKVNWSLWCGCGVVMIIMSYCFLYAFRFRWYLCLSHACASMKKYFNISCNTECSQKSITLFQNTHYFH